MEQCDKLTDHGVEWRLFAIALLMGWKDQRGGSISHGKDCFGRCMLSGLLLSVLEPLATNAAEWQVLNGAKFFLSAKFHRAALYDTKLGLTPRRAAPHSAPCMCA